MTELLAVLTPYAAGLLAGWAFWYWSPRKAKPQPPVHLTVYVLQIDGRTWTTEDAKRWHAVTMN